MKRMVGRWKKFEGSTCAKLFDEGFQQFQLSKLVATALQEEHRDLYLEQVLCPLCRRLARRMQGKAQENKTLHAEERRCGLRLRGHPTAKGFAAREQWQFRNQPGSRDHRRVDGGLGKFRGIRTF